VRRGDLVTVAVSGDYGKPRSALIVQADVYAEHPSVTVLPLTSELIDAPLLRVSVEPGAGTGLRRRSQVMVDKGVVSPNPRNF
jgi:mRNA interferase MazF